jgi:hypothetical protein
VREVSGVAASSLLAPLLTGRPRRGEVVLSSPTAAYAQVGRDVIALLLPGATSLPCAVLLPHTGALDLPPAGARIAVGDGTVTWPDRRCAVTRWWLPARVRRGRLDAGRVAAFTAAVSDPMTGSSSSVGAGDRHRIAEVVARLLRAEVEEAAGLALTVLGRGAGSTPAADDALAGALLTLRAAGALEDSDLARLDRLLTPATTRTTVLSAALLRHAAAGWAADAVVRAVTAVQPGAVVAGDAPGTARTLLGLGHTSGADTAVGIVVAAAAVVERAQQAGGLGPDTYEVA